MTTEKIDALKLLEQMQVKPGVSKVYGDPAELDLNRLEALHGAANFGKLTSHHIVSNGYEHMANLVDSPANGEDELARGWPVCMTRKEWSDSLASAHNALPALIAEVRRLRNALMMSEQYRKAYQDGKMKLYSMGGDICAAAIDHLPCGEGALDYLSATIEAEHSPVLLERLKKALTENERLQAECERMDKVADVELDVQVACDTTVYETVKRVTGRRDYHSVMEAVEDLARECERLRDNGWKPIAEAPKDGTYIFAWSSERKMAFQVRWNSDYSDWQIISGGVLNPEITHFRLLRGPEGV